MIGQLELDRHDTPIFRSIHTANTARFKQMFRESNGYGLCDKNGRRVSKSLPVVTLCRLEKLAEIIQSRKEDKVRLKSAAAIFVAIYCGVPYHNIPEITFNQKTGVLKYRGKDFLPSTEAFMLKLWNYGVRQGSCDANIEPPLDSLRKVFSVPVDLYTTFGRALSSVKTGLPEPQAILNMLRSLKMPRSIFFPQQVFLGRLERLKASNQFKSLFLLPWSRIPPYDNGLTIMKHFEDEVSFNFNRRNHAPQDFVVAVVH